MITTTAHVIANVFCMCGSIRDAYYNINYCNSSEDIDYKYTNCKFFTKNGEKFVSFDYSETIDFNSGDVLLSVDFCEDFIDGFEVMTGAILDDVTITVERDYTFHLEHDDLFPMYCID